MWFTHKHRAPDPCMQIQQYSLVELCAYGVLAEKSVFGKLMVGVAKWCDDDYRWVWSFAQPLRWVR